MEQKEYTEYVIPKLLEHFPMFENDITIRPEGITDIDHKSNRGKLVLWITTQDKEITIGLTCDEKGDWHTHMSLFGANTPDEEIEVAVGIINDIIGDRLLIVNSEEHGYIPYGPEEDGESCLVFKSSEL